MATRNISTKLAISGESEYRAALKNINSELKSLQSSLKLTQSQYQTNANTMQALSAKSEALRKVYEAQKKKVDELKSALENARKAEQEYAKQKEDLSKKIEANNKALDALKKTTGDTTKEEEKLNAENAKLQKEMDGVEAKLAAAQRGTNDWQVQLNNAQIKLNDLDAEIQKNDKYMDEASKSADGCAHSIDEFGNEVHEASDEVKTMASIMASREIIDFGNNLKQALGDCIKSFADFEEGMAGVKRTTGIVGPDLDELGEYFKQLSTEIPLTTKELTEIATTAGQLGVKGKDNVQQFTEVMAKLATTTDLTADTAATMLAQFANITHVTDYERLGSVVASLGDATATTATKVVEMSQGIAAAGTQAGMRERDILAISAAVGSLGIESAAGGTAMSTLISTIYKATQKGGDDLRDFAAVAGMSAGQFKKYWQEDAVGALNAFITGLNDTERNGKSAVVILDELGITNVRQTRAILGLAEAGDLLTGTIQQANEAWEENIALDEKASIMFDTMNAHMTTLENATDNLKVEIGAALAPTVNALLDQGQDVIEGITKFVQQHPQLTSALVTVAGGIVGVTTAIAGVKLAYKTLDFLGMTGGLKALQAAAAEAGGGLAGFGAALGALATTAGIAGTALLSVYTIIDRAKEVETVGLLGEGHTLEEYKDNVDKYKASIVQLQEEYNNLAENGGDLTMAQDALTMAEIALENATVEYMDELHKLGQTEEEVAQGSEELSTAFANQGYTMDDAKIDLQDLAEAYNEAYNSARGSLEGQISLFDWYTKEISEDTDTAKEMLDRWQQQVWNLDEYTRNLEKAAKYGLDDGLVRSLADGSTESAGYLFTIIQEIENCEKGVGTLGTSADEAVAQFNASFKQTEEAKDNLAETMAAINTGLEDALEEMQDQLDEGVSFEEFYDAVDLAFEEVGIKFHDIGINMGEGMIGGMQEKSLDVSTAATGVADDATNATKMALGIQSPSTVFHEIGVNIDLGLIEGINQERPNVETAVREMGDSVVQIMTASATTATLQWIAQFQIMVIQTQGIMLQCRNVIIGSMNGMPGMMVSIGENIIYGMIQGLSNREGALYSKIRSIVSSAIAAARAAAEVQSPSKKTKEIFEYVGEGMIVGIESKKKQVEAATEDVVRNAVSFDSNTIHNLSKEFSSSLPDFTSIFSDNDQKRRKQSNYADEPSEAKNITNNFNVNITTQPGQNNKEIAEYVMDYIITEVDKERSRFN